MIRVIRTQLDTGAITVVRATEHGLTIDMDGRHITPTGAASLQQALNGLAPHADAEPGDQRTPDADGDGRRR
ncbi:hypothetical protein OHB39_05640 [Streptomyces sp. NBC_00047]|uniref:hypothetical protein n=1 Tax=Streptomyces sp. NBC_00047 TaxID=2975627 RepID=UPI002258768A|nr:hypothetical protein [Streptomyces sp. NBC_00047]MCX5607065.1 hypothetical protein [Streptomyces sp. NBC_00047]